MNTTLALILFTVLLVAVNCQRPDFSFPSNTRGRTRRPVTTRTTSTTTTPGSNTPVVPGASIEVMVTSPCPCPFTPEYNPVCGTNGQTYGNRGILNCHTSCGRRVQFAFYGACRAISG